MGTPGEGHEGIGSHERQPERGTSTENLAIPDGIDQIAHPFRPSTTFTHIIIAGSLLVDV